MSKPVVLEWTYAISKFRYGRWYSNDETFLYLESLFFEIKENYYTVREVGRKTLSFRGADGKLLLNDGLFWKQIREKLGFLTVVIVLVFLWLDCMSLCMLLEAAIICLNSYELNNPFDRKRHAKFLLLLTFHFI